jgi:arsenate reductase
MKKSMTAKIYHNSRCSKSRATLAILEQNNVDFEIVNYLQETPSESELRSLLSDLDINARDLIRKGEQAYKDLNLADMSISDEDLIAAMIKFPILIERPIVKTSKGAAIGRPPENVLSIL